MEQINISQVNKLYVKILLDKIIKNYTEIFYMKLKIFKMIL